MSQVAEFARGLRVMLDRVAEQGGRIAFWWRDDDTTETTPALDALLGAARRHRVPLAVAVIPEPVTDSLAVRLSTEGDRVAIFQHGFAHRNHAPKGEKAAELGAHRPAGIVLDELRRGREKLETLFGDRFVPVLTPPWNRIGEEAAVRRGEAGLLGLSTFAAMHAGDPACVNTHVDIIDWKRGRGFAGYEKMTKVFTEEISRRGTTTSVPLGLLTHHLDHDEDCRDFLEAFLSVAARHPAARWPNAAELFDLRSKRR